MMQSIKKMFVHTLITAMVFVGFTQTVQAAMVSTEQVVSSAAAQQNRAKISATFDRADVQAELAKMGISADEAKARVAALSDAETASIAHRVDAIPAGGDGIIGALIFIFVVLLVTDILGLTKVFPFTRSMRH
ncbi:PA2779 family protein [Massilia sp. S19_KUP03_FR1]|uniref:PA2779 family protein n=1 Tax=Massilia sp. S19_KUP03_FR1 TaxID=3025503 RepID=UPI002FCDB67F